MTDVNITYNGQKVSVSKEVADYLGQDKRRSAAEGRSDRRHLSMGDSEQASYYRFSGKDDLENLVIENLMKESLRKVLGKLPPTDRELLYLYYWKEMSMQQIADKLRVSKMAVSKRHKKILMGLRAVLL